MVPDDMATLFALLTTSPAIGHPFVLDVLIGIAYGIAIGLALSAVRSGSR